MYKLRALTNFHIYSAWKYSMKKDFHKFHGKVFLYFSSPLTLILLPLYIFKCFSFFFCQVLFRFVSTTLLLSVLSLHNRWAPLGYSELKCVLDDDDGFAIWSGSETMRKLLSIFTMENVVAEWKFRNKSTCSRSDCILVSLFLTLRERCSGFAQHKMI